MKGWNHVLIIENASTLGGAVGKIDRQHSVYPFCWDCTTKWRRICAHTEYRAMFWHRPSLSPVCAPCTSSCQWEAPVSSWLHTNTICNRPFKKWFDGSIHLVPVCVTDMFSVIDRLLMRSREDWFLAFADVGGSERFTAAPFILYIEWNQDSINKYSVAGGKNGWEGITWFESEYWRWIFLCQDSKVKLLSDWNETTSTEASFEQMFPSELVAKHLYLPASCEEAQTICR